MTEPVIDDALRFLRGHSRADLQFDGNQRPLKYVIAPDGRIAAPVMVAMLRSVDCVLFVPENAEGALEAQVTLEQFEERGGAGALADRWRIYHGEPDDVRWASFTIDAARHQGMVIDGAALTVPNPLAAEEARLCRWINTEHQEDLKRACARLGAMQIEHPVLVGIDPMGLDVRAMFDIVRVPATQPMNSVAEAERALKALCAAR